MAIEAASSIYELNQNLPLDADEQAEGDDHIRVIKSVLKAVFPGMGGALGRVISKAIGFTPGVTENTCIFHCTAAITVALPAVASAPDGTYYLINAFGGDLVIDPNGTELINGQSTVTVSSGSWVLVGKLGGAWIALVTALPNTAVHAATVKAVAVDADEMLLVDSADSWKLKKLTVADLKTVVNDFGSLSTAESAGITNWNDARITKAGPCPYLVVGNASNGPGGSYYYHVLNFEYAYKNGSGNCTQVAIPYGGVPGGTSRWYVRSRYSGTWSSWAAIPTTADPAGFASASQAGVTSVGGYTGAVTAGQIAASATAGYGYTPANPANMATKDCGHNAVGSFCLVVYNAASTAAPGSTFAGSSLRAMGFARGDDGYGVYMTQTGSALSGTWRILGCHSNVSALADGTNKLTMPATLAQRIS